MTRILLACSLFLLGTFTLKAQLPLTEADISPKIVVKFYGSFPGSTLVEWYQVAEHEDYNYYVKFTQDLNQVQAWVDARGNVVKEAAKGKSIPTPMMNMLDEKYGKYKVKEIEYEKDNATGLASYEVILKTKEHGEFDLKMDQNFTIMDNKGSIAYQ